MPVNSAIGIAHDVMGVEDLGILLAHPVATELDEDPSQLVEIRRASGRTARPRPR